LIKLKILSRIICCNMAFFFVAYLSYDELIKIICILIKLTYLKGYMINMMFSFFSESIHYFLRLVFYYVYDKQMSDAFAVASSIRCDNVYIYVYIERKRMYCVYFHHHISYVLLSETILFQIDCQTLVI
jgi:hypothetical protein